MEVHGNIPVLRVGGEDQYSIVCKAIPRPLTAMEDADPEEDQVDPAVVAEALSTEATRGSPETILSEAAKQVRLKEPDARDISSTWGSGTVLLSAPIINWNRLMKVEARGATLDAERSCEYSTTTARLLDQSQIPSQVL